MQTPTGGEFRFSMSGYDPRITILGAGLAGLSAALSLARMGYRVRVIEREEIPGGMAMTIKRGEYRFDLGPHRLYTKDQTVLNIVKELLGDEIIIHQRTSRVRLNGYFLDYPPNVANLVRCMEPKTSLHCLLDYFSVNQMVPFYLCIIPGALQNSNGDTGSTSSSLSNFTCSLISNLGIE